MSPEGVGPGATAVGIKIKDGVILAAEKRVSYGGYILSKTGRKVFKISDRIAIAAAGLFADMQTIARILSAEVMYRELLTSMPMSVKAAAKLLSSILYRYKSYPFLSEILLGGIDEEGTHLFVLDPVGSVIEDNYAAIGTGATIAIGIIESRYSVNMSIEEAVRLAIDAIKAASLRDAVSGDGIDIAVVDRNGVREEFVPLA